MYGCLIDLLKEVCGPLIDLIVGVWNKFKELLWIHSENFMGVFTLGRSNRFSVTSPHVRLLLQW